MNVVEAGRSLAAEAARLAELGWMRGTAGNLSVRLGDDPLRLAVTASGRDKAELTHRDVVVVDGDGRPVPGDGVAAPRPSAEAGLHARIAAVTGAGAIVHGHLLDAAVAAERWPGGVVLRDVEMLKGLGRAAEDDVVTVPVVPNSQDMAVLGRSFTDTHDPAVPALIVARHGVYVWGRDLHQARHRAECLDWLVRFALATAE